MTFVVFQESGTGWTTISTDTVAASASGIAVLRYAPKTAGTWSVVAYAQATATDEASAMTERAVMLVR